ncbi:hypothetical protein [Pasteurella sp. PK-2025]|uniref:hypothetical protein n=1 Tax=Pasteurella sp. PK-2025 TaxID=3413133 RepID=UPI003C707950
MMVCGKVGANASPAFDAGGRVIWGNNKEIFEFGAEVKVIGGVEVDAQINWNNIKERF